ncbi:DUF2637 domain-containing protein [Rhodococcus spongiicola]|uniref:DUF2637 domain-containing protein n=1 Tax=Rhodococcus spongiicola TaxID=2487352 RepID=A0A438B729_9NOCA|nr:DUF2637 domain-containing protein [Rhodococcus spongiicola]
MVGTTYAIAVLAFVLSYSKLTDLAERANYSPLMARAWPLIVDGLAVVATVGVMRMRRRGYAWFLLFAATTVSIVAAIASAMLPPGPLPPVAAAAVSVAAALCLLAAPHLAVKIQRDAAQSRDTSHLAPAQRKQVTAQTGLAPHTSQPAQASHRAPAKPAPSTEHPRCEVSTEQSSSAPRTEQADRAAAQTTPDLHTSQFAAHATAQADREVQLHLVGRDDAQPRVAQPKPRAVKYTDAQIAETLALVASGVSQREAGRRIGASGNTVRAWVAKAAAL